MISFDGKALVQNQQHEYHTTKYTLTDKIYDLGCILTKPFSWNVTNGAKIFCHSNPGETTPRAWINLTKNLLRGVVFVVTIVPAAGLAAVGFPLRLIGKAFSNDMTLMEGTPHHSTYDPKKGLHLMTYNVGLVPKLFDAILDTRPSFERAKAIATAISELKPEEQPDIICFQEVFDDKSSGELFNGLRGNYHHILHSIVPSEMGVGSGAAFASKYPILSASFRRFDDLVGDDSLTKQGLLRVELDLGNGKTAVVYNTHLQSGDDAERQQVRQNEVKQIRAWMEEDAQKDVTEGKAQSRHGTFLLGDLNVKRFGELEEKSADYDQAMVNFGDQFKNAFYEDHDKMGKRTQGVAKFASERLKEPKGSFYEGAQQTRNAVTPNQKHRYQWGETGISSGATFSSDYPILSASFRRLNDSSKNDSGLLRVELDLGEGKSAVVYKPHLQGKGNTEDVAKMRQWMAQDAEADLGSGKAASREKIYLIGNPKVKDPNDLRTTFECVDKLPETIGGAVKSDRKYVWDKTGWSAKQRAIKGCVEDHQLIFNPAHQPKREFKTHSEIRQFVDKFDPEAKSGISDHLPVSVIYKEKSIPKPAMQQAG